ncbi:hypothetical protein HYPBUDRAFT_153117 [Hyphopichia burtonii NRRL Y-1933]|uniref:AAA protein C-terminal winged helix domain-containing protein n=1 Tax=Hyphopichia burtonii NRRL Y-1933 TaxID=984485 RepID=A0A1E4RJ01_9ASCO|nr:hypothetical protein HYPBUDRAFT_153117 [Hyphopichia burtonii NRRL Y-1933]ODV67252.1 hypothetical protein HYPBUDRAFT_153117 [Hyphopichia burtonii NRRL Y-1933]
MIRRGLLGSIPRLNRSIPRVAKSRIILFHTTPPRFLNPLLPFDVLEEVQNDELEEENKKLTKQKKKLIREKKKVEQKNEDKEKEDQEFQSKEDTIPLKKAVATTDAKPVDTRDEYVGVKEAAKARVRSQRDEVGDNNNNNNNNNNNTNNNNNNNNNDNDADKKKEEEKKEQEKNEEEKKRKEEEERKKEEEKQEEEYEEEHEDTFQDKLKETISKFNRFLFKCLETIGITFSSVAILGVAGILYHKFYNQHVLDKIDEAFEKGDPAYQLAIHKRTYVHEDENISKYWVQRPQQELLDDIVSGKISGRYYLMVGEKGTGKTTLLLESMKRIDGQNVAIFDAHADPEIFRIRLGKALNFAYSEDYIGSLFSIRGPRDTTALLDIERAFSKLEELAIKRKMDVGKNSRPLVMIINNSHLIKENEEGIKLIELLQQKAESLSGSGLVTMIFNSDDYWVYEKLKRLGTRLELINVRDFNRGETLKALKFIREKFFPSTQFPQLKLSDDQCNQIYNLIGGRPQHISQVARHKDIIRASHEIIDREKTWLLNQCGLLGSNMDDDVMESGKFSSSCMLLMREFVEMDRQRANSLIINQNEGNELNHHLPELPLWRARQIMTRADYIQQYDNLNIFTLDSELRVRADSVPMMRAFHEIALQPHFDELLQDTIERVADIESLARTREIVAKDLNLGSKYQITKKDNWTIDMKKLQKSVDLHGLPDEEADYNTTQEEDHDDELFMEDIHRKDIKKWWKKRMGRE